MKGRKWNFEFWTVDWSAQQVLGSMCLYPDWGEERLASPEVPSAGGLRIHSTLLTAIWWWMWQVLKRVLMRSTLGQWDRGNSHTKGAAVIPKQDTPVQETLLGVMSEAPGWLCHAIYLYTEGDLANGIQCISDFQRGGTMVSILPVRGPISL